MTAVNDWLSCKNHTQPFLNFHFEKENIFMQSRLHADKNISIKANILFLDKKGYLEADKIEINTKYLIVIEGDFVCKDLKIDTDRVIILNAKFAAQSPKFENAYENQRTLTKEFQKLLDSLGKNQKAEDLFSQFEKELHEIKRPKEKGETPDNPT